MENKEPSSVYHIPILVEEISNLLAWEKSERIIDLTVGGGGHLLALLSQFPRPTEIWANDQDLEAIAESKKKLQAFEPIHWVHGNFRDIRKLTSEKFDRVLIDLGVSSHQLDDASRGFSFQKEGPLDMRMDQTRGMPASEWLMQCDITEFANIVYEYGEERSSRVFARRWAEARGALKGRDLTTAAFVQALGFNFNSKNPQGRHPLTRVFQALRIHLNQEWQALDEVLNLLPDLLSDKGRLSILTFHSLEDRKVKWALRGKLKPINKKVIQAGETESRANPRSRSAKLRVYEKMQTEELE